MDMEGEGDPNARKGRKLRPRDQAKVCGANTPHGPCQQWKGYGTDHPRIGACKKHGGATATHNKAAARTMEEQRMVTYGAPIKINPLEGLTQEVERTAGHVAWLQELVGNLLHDGDGYSESISDDGKRILRSNTGLTQMDASGKLETTSVWLKMYHEERSHFARVCKMALEVGIDEKALAVMKMQGAHIATLMTRLLDALNLDAAQRQEANEVVAREFHLIIGSKAS